MKLYKIIEKLKELKINFKVSFYYEKETKSYTIFIRIKDSSLNNKELRELANMNFKYSSGEIIKVIYEGDEK